MKLHSPDLEGAVCDIWNKIPNSEHTFVEILDELRNEFRTQAFQQNIVIMVVLLSVGNYCVGRNSR